MPTSPAQATKSEPTTADVPDVRRLDVRAIQRRFVIGPRALYKWINEGRFPPPDLVVGKNRRRLWNVATVEAWEREERERVIRETSSPAAGRRRSRRAPTATDTRGT